MPLRCLAKCTVSVFVVVIASVGLGTPALGAIASDNASNSPYISGQSIIGLNGGNGFNAWSVESGTGTASITSGPVFTIAGAPGYFEVQRPLGTSLQIGETFSVTVEWTGGRAGVNLYAGNQTTNNSGYLHDNLGLWYWDDGSGAVSTGVSITGASSFTFTRTAGTNAYSMTFGSFSRSGVSTLSTEITSVSFDNNAGALHVNNLQIVPEPSNLVLLAAAGLSFFAFFRRRGNQWTHIPSRRFLQAAPQFLRPSHRCNFSPVFKALQLGNAKEFSRRV